MTSELISKLIILFSCLFVLGTLACLPLYNWSLRQLVKSSLWIKIIWWIPIFGGLIILLYLHTAVALFLTIIGLAVAWREFSANAGWKSRIGLSYFIFFLLCTAHLPFFWSVHGIELATAALIFVCFSSVLSDIFAFFFGNYLPFLALPSWINARKSWSGVFGQIVGAVVGALLVIYTFQSTFTVWIGVLIGCASAFGDLANSTAKRSLGIKDWGNTIPGHGGVLDRFSSLATAIAVLFWIL